MCGSVEWRVYLHAVEERAGGDDVVAALGVVGRVLLGPVRLARARHAHHEDHLDKTQATLLIKPLFELQI